MLKAVAGNEGCAAAPEGLLQVMVVEMGEMVQQLMPALHMQAAVGQVDILGMVEEAVGLVLQPLVLVAAVVEHMVVVQQEVPKLVVVA